MFCTALFTGHGYAGEETKLLPQSDKVALGFYLVFAHMGMKSKGTEQASCKRAHVGIWQRANYDQLL